MQTGPIEVSTAAGRATSNTAHAREVRRGNENYEDADVGDALRAGGAAT